jgi:hypothetical protein
VILFDVREPVAAGFDTASSQQIDLYRSSRFLAAASPSVFQALVTCAVAAGLWVLSGRSVANIAAIGSVALLSLRAVSQGQLAQQAVQTLGAQQGFISQLLATEGQLTAVAAGFGSEDTPHIESLSLRAAMLRHDDRFALGPVDLEIARHEVVGLVGQSGAGKSTVVDLLSRLRRPTSGSLLVNGRDATTFSAASWAAHRLRRRSGCRDSAGSRAACVTHESDAPRRRLDATGPARTRSTHGRRASRRQSGTAGHSSRSGNDNASAWPVPSRQSPTSCCSTRRPALSTTRARNGSARPWSR